MRRLASGSRAAPPAGCDRGRRRHPHDTLIQAVISHVDEVGDVHADPPAKFNELLPVGFVGPARFARCELGVRQAFTQAVVLTLESFEHDRRRGVQWITGRKQSI